MAPKKARDRKRQTKINFSPASQSLPATKSTAATTMGTSPSRPNLTAMRPTRRAPSRVSNKSNTNKHDSSSEDELVVGTNKTMRLGMPVGSTARGMFDGSNNGSASSKTEEEDDEVQAGQPKSRKRRRAATPSESEDEEPTVTVIPRKRQRRVIEIGSDTAEKPKDKKKEDNKKKSSKPSKRRERKESTPEEEESQPAPRSSRRRTAKKAPTPDEDDDEDEPLTPVPSSRRKIARRRSPSLEEEEEEQSPPRSTRRRLKRRKSLSEDEEESSATTQLTNRGDSASDDEDEDEEEGEGSADNDEENEEQDELKEELAFLRSSPLPDRGRLRSTQGKPKNKRQEALEALKRRRAGTNEPSSSATPGRKRAVVVETDSESELEVIKEEPESDPEILEQDDIEDDEQESDRDANALDMFQEDQEDEHFIDDDPDNVLGEPSVNDDLDEMRLAFSLSRAKTRDLFKHAVEWMVMKKIHPGFDAEKNVYVLTFRKLDDEVKGLAGSKYTSSAWTADFTRAIRARPLLLMNELSAAERAVMSPHCEACNRTNHTASFEVLFQGQPYHPETLEPLANASDSSSDSDSDSDSALSADSETQLNGEKPTFNYQGDRIPPESHRFPLGSTCKANAQVAHTLYHWRYNLYQWVKDYLKDEGHLTAEKLVKRDGRSDRKREKEARKIVDTMEENGRIRQLYHSYKDQLRAAVEADNDYANGWGRRG
ncbi:hypothetical protein J4E91_004462 [Alternaria rosae]|nr:hypothetical protein J4E91_004462 [Alternaria rosae]